MTTRRPGPSPVPGAAATAEGVAGDDPLGLRARDARRRLVLLALIAATAVSGLLAIGIGPVAIPPGRVAEILLNGAAGGQSDAAIVTAVRLPRVLLGMAVGCSLAVSGAVLQAVVRNRLADPYILGMSGGATTGAAAVITLGAGAAAGCLARPLLAFLGALGASALVILLARTAGQVSSSRLLLAGVATGYALTGVTNLLVLTADSAEASRSVMFWMLGSLSLSTWDAPLWIAVATALGGVTLLSVLAPQLDALATGDETAHALGVRPGPARVRLLVIASLCTGTAVAVAGAIGFVGLVVPHLARRLVGPLHRLLIPASALLGMLLLLWADALARVALAPRELSIGIITALIGAPFLLLLIRRPHPEES